MAAVDDFVRDYDGRQNVSFDGIKDNVGQCVQPVGYYIRDYLKKPLLYRNAYYLIEMATAFPNDWGWIPNTRDATPLPGDIILWDPKLPNSGNAGHVAVCVTPRPGTGTFVSFDSNWGGKYCHKVTHNYDYVAGWLRPKYAAPAPPAPAPSQPKGDKPMTPDEEREAYEIVLERPMEGAASGRTGITFMRGAKPELAIKRQAIAQQMANLSGTINTQNQTITDLTTKLQDSTISNKEKQQALDDALTKLGQTNGQLATAHDTIVDLQNCVNVTDKPVPAPTSPAPQSPTPPTPSTAQWFYNLLALLTKWKAKK